jgi:hypothetical protein
MIWFSYFFVARIQILFFEINLPYCSPVFLFWSGFVPFVLLSFRFPILMIVYLNVHYYFKLFLYDINVFLLLFIQFSTLSSMVALHSLIVLSVWTWFWNENCVICSRLSHYFGNFLKILFISWFMLKVWFLNSSITFFSIMFNIQPLLFPINFSFPSRLLLQIWPIYLRSLISSETFLDTYQFCHVLFQLLSCFL